MRLELGADSLAQRAEPVSRLGEKILIRLRLGVAKVFADLFQSEGVSAAIPDDRRRRFPFGISSNGRKARKIPARPIGAARRPAEKRREVRRSCSSRRQDEQIRADAPTLPG